MWQNRNYLDYVRSPGVGKGVEFVFPFKKHSSQIITNTYKFRLLGSQSFMAESTGFENHFRLK